MTWKYLIFYLLIADINDQDIGEAPQNVNSDNEEPTEEETPVKAQKSSVPSKDTEFIFYY